MLPEEVVVAVPLAMVVERDEEEVLPLDRFEQDCAVLAVRQHGAQLRAQARDDRRAREEPDDVGGLIGQHLSGQVVRDLATLTRGQGPRPVTRLPRERGEVHARRPALRRELQRLDHGVLRLEPMEGQQSGCALPIEAESREAILGKQIPRKQAPEVQRRIGSAAGDDGRTHGHGLDQHAQDLPAARVTDEVGVVQHQDEGGRGRHRLGQRRNDGLPDRRIGQGEPHQDLRIERGEGEERPREVLQEHDGVVVAGVELEPPAGPPVDLEPLSDRRGLPGAGWSREQYERRGLAQQGVHETLPADGLAQRAGRPQLEGVGGEHRRAHGRVRTGRRGDPSCGGRCGRGAGTSGSSVGSAVSHNGPLSFGETLVVSTPTNTNRGSSVNSSARHGRGRLDLPADR